jgi:hypothetical protein
MDVNRSFESGGDLMINTKTYGKWELSEKSLIIYTPGHYEYSLPLHDLRDTRMAKICIGMMAVKSWITLDDMIFLKKAIADIQRGQY